MSDSQVFTTTGSSSYFINSNPPTFVSVPIKEKIVDHIGLLQPIKHTEKKSIEEFENSLTELQVYKKYKSYSVKLLNDIIQKYYKDTLQFINDEEEHEYLCSAYYPIGHFKLIQEHHFRVRYLPSQCGLRAVDSYFNYGYYLDDMSQNNRDKLFIIIFMIIVKTIEEKKPGISLLFSDTSNSSFSILLNKVFQQNPVYTERNPNTTSLVNYYMFNAKNLDLL